MTISKSSILNAAFNAVRDTFKTMIDIDVEQGSIFNREESSELEDIKIVASIPLRNPPTFDGKLILYISEIIYLTILSKMVGQELTMESEEAKTGAGEILNIVSGHLNIILAKQGYLANQADIPKVLEERDRKILHMTLAENLTMIFNSKLGSFFVEVQTVE